MNEAQCLELRDLISRCTFPADEHGHVHRRFRFVAVTPGGDGADATVHINHLEMVWRLAGVEETPLQYLESVIAHSPFAARKINVAHCREWTAPWEITAVDPGRDFPTLILFEHPDRSVDGVLMREPHHGSHTDLADAYPERAEALALLADLQALERYQPFMRWYKESNIHAASLDEACAAAPESPVGQKFVVVYRGDEWFFGIWNNPVKIPRDASKPLSLSSIADFHGTRVSKSKLDTRSGLELVKGRETLRGESAVLEFALTVTRKLRQDGVDFKVGEFEAHPGVQSLCTWWNTVAPEPLRSAGCFRLYVWDEKRKVFQAGDPDEPAMDAGVLANCGPFAVFEKPGAPLVAATFYRGREFNVARGGGSVVFSVNGEEAYDMGLALHEMDEAYYSALGLAARSVQAFART